MNDESWQCSPDWGKTGEDYARHQFSACQLQCHLEVAPVSILTCQLVQCRALSVEGTGGTRQGWAEAVASLPGSSVSEMSPLETQYHSLSSKLHLHPQGLGRLPANQRWPAGCTPALSCSSPVQFCHPVSYSLPLPKERTHKSQPWEGGLFQACSSLAYPPSTLKVIGLPTFAILWSSLVAQWVKDPASSLLWHRFGPWPGNFQTPLASLHLSFTSLNSFVNFVKSWTIFC